ncbi:hypothetical protein CEXT_546121 [Caerostris extrusa]|uniref:Uncharacterized protein n=1 Tax=Caerostris extrusa TaxID=172846 RepID=A0AAV4RZC8_CAEEX|nr:hypothetical protein CEXT_546121 [Caerostris extrusa]
MRFPKVAKPAARVLKYIYGCRCLSMTIAASCETQPPSSQASQKDLKHCSTETLGNSSPLYLSKKAGEFRIHPAATSAGDMKSRRNHLHSWLRRRDHRFSSSLTLSPANSSVDHFLPLIEGASPRKCERLKFRAKRSPRCLKGELTMFPHNAFGYI